MPVFSSSAYVFPAGKPWGILVLLRIYFFLFVTFRLCQSSKWEWRFHICEHPSSYIKKARMIDASGLSRKCMIFFVVDWFVIDFIFFSLWIFRKKFSRIFTFLYKKVWMYCYFLWTEFRQYKNTIMKCLRNKSSGVVELISLCFRISKLFLQNCSTCAKILLKVSSILPKLGYNDLKMAPSANETEFITKESLPKSRIEGF